MTTNNETYLRYKKALFEGSAEYRRELENKIRKGSYNITGSWCESDISVIRDKLFCKWGGYNGPKREIENIVESPQEGMPSYAYKRFKIHIKNSAVPIIAYTLCYNNIERVKITERVRKNLEGLLNTKSYRSHVNRTLNISNTVVPGDIIVIYGRFPCAHRRGLLFQEDPEKLEHIKRELDDNLFI